MYSGNLLQKVATLNCGRTLCAMLLLIWLWQSRAWAYGLNGSRNLGGCRRVLQERLRRPLDVLVLDTGNKTIDFPLNLNNTPALYQHVRAILRKDANGCAYDGPRRGGGAFRASAQVQSCFNFAHLGSGKSLKPITKGCLNTKHGSEVTSDRPGPKC